MTSIADEGQARSLRLSQADSACFQQAADQLLAAFHLSADTAPCEERWQPDRPVVAAFSEANIIGPIWTGELDDLSNSVTARSVSSTNGIHELDQRGCTLLDELAERWALHPNLAGLSTAAAMLDRLQRWCHHVLETGQHTDSVNFILSDLQSSLATHEVWIQLAGIEVEDCAPVGKVELRGVSLEKIESWMRALRTNGVEQAKLEGVEAYLVQRWQGHAAAVYRAYGDTAAVKEAAIEHAERTCALLRVIDPKSRSATARSHLQPVTLLSQVNLREMIIDPSEMNVSFSCWPLDGMSSSPVDITLTRENLPAIWEEGMLRHAHELLSSDHPSQFQEHLLRSLLIHSRQRLSIDPIEKLIFAVSALEALLYAGNPNAYQGTLKRRLCGVMAGSHAFKEHIEQTVGKAYKLRKQFLHHGHRIGDVRAVQEFLSLAWLFFRRALDQHERWPTIEAYCAALDDAYEKRFGKSEPT